ncbi:MAG: PorT family protein [Bacteroidales bacterium]|nr:PorT family protein [Bacteroidales bacterium]
MKKLLLVAILFSLSCGLMAQISFGPKIGYTTGKLSTDKSDITTSMKSSFLFGAFLRLGGKVYLQPEVNWYTAGGVFKKPSLTGISPFEDEVNLKSIQIPLYLGYKLLDLKLVQVRAQAGPTASIITSKSINPLKPLDYGAQIKEADIKDVLWGLQFGAGVDVLMFTLDVQYMFGLNKLIGDVQVTTDAGTTETVKFDSRQQGFMVSLGWKIF